MPFIPNFPASFLEEHRRWHHVNHHNNPASLPIGYGANFLDFHRQYLAKVLPWYQQQGYDMRLVAPWQEVPEQIRSAPCYDRAAEMRIRNNPESFATADELGRFLEASNLHGCIHEIGAALYGEPDLNDFDVAPHSTIFYNIHGMIEQWYQNWERAKGLRLNSVRGAKKRDSGLTGRRTGGLRGAARRKSKLLRRSGAGKLRRRVGGKPGQTTGNRKPGKVKGNLWMRPAARPQLRIKGGEGKTASAAKRPLTARRLAGRGRRTIP
ncbi:hypothetical protein [Paenibacillus nasutitermitis]|uniref:Uncharacterized protein n=1 Tax=Paenibacillus nasutitermitis TaxID=1652958 RepID=A0A916ZBS8_9BACL|nr:hypothetical protein [Paenibacillus nasutitermitis]GGD86704.1 hypothetical protein GCM10010911_51480 [Paenibacillus nasutitermitis]